MQDIKTQLVAIITNHLTNTFPPNPPRAEIEYETLLQEDLMFDSLDAIEVVMAIEEHFDIIMRDPEIENIRTVGDVIQLIEAKLKSGADSSTTLDAETRKRMMRELNALKKLQAFFLNEFDCDISDFLNVLMERLNERVIVLEGMLDPWCKAKDIVSREPEVQKYVDHLLSQNERYKSYSVEFREYLERDIKFIGDLLTVSQIVKLAAGSSDYQIERMNDHDAAIKTLTHYYNCESISEYELDED